MKVPYFLALSLTALPSLFAEKDTSAQTTAFEQKAKLESLEAALAREFHTAKPVESGAGAWIFTNRAHGLQAEIKASGATFTVKSTVQDTFKNFSLLWRTASIDYGDLSLELSDGEVTSCPKSNRIEIRRPGSIEWFVNHPHGIEQGYTILERPANSDQDSPLKVWFDVGGDFEATVGSCGQQIVLRDRENDITLHYDQLKSWDAEGRSLPSRMISDKGRVGIEVEVAAAVYPITIDPTFTQSAYLKASNTRDEAVFFGHNVSIDGNTAVVGAPGERSAATGVNGNQSSYTKSQSGAAYVFVYNGTDWAQQAYLKASNTDAADWFGGSVAISGNTIVVGAPDERGSSNTINGPDNNNLTDAGAAYVFVRNGTSWSQQAYLKPANINSLDNFGRSVAIDGNTIIVGAPREDGSATTVNGADNNSATDAGAAYVFTRADSTWSHQAYLKAANAGAGDNFGFHVAVSGDTAIVGAILEDGSATTVNGNSNNDATDSGAAYVFSRTGTIWSQQAYLKPNNTGAGDYFGYRVAVDGDTALVGAPYEDSSSKGINGDGSDDLAGGSGAAYVFVRGNPTAWTQQAYLKASNADPNDNFGIGASISGDVVLVGAFGEDSIARGLDGDQGDNSASGSGAAYCFSRAGSTWTQRAYLKASNTESGAGSWDHFGNAVSISGPLAIIGANDEHSDAIGINGNGFNNSIESAGAAYAFVVDIPPPAPGIAVFGNGLSISNGASNATLQDNTRFPSPNTPGETVFRDFTIRNTGDATLNLSGDLVLTGSSAFELIVTPDPVILPESESVFVIAFDSSLPGSHSAVIAIQSDAVAASPFTFLIQGVGAQPMISVISGTKKLSSRGSISFRPVRVGRRGNPATLNVQNPGVAPLVGINASIRGGTAKDYRIIRRLPNTLAPSGSAFLQISFNPTRKGKRSSLLEVRSNAVNVNPFLLNLSGTGK